MTQKPIIKKLRDLLSSTECKLLTSNLYINGVSYIDYVLGSISFPIGTSKRLNTLAVTKVNKTINYICNIINGETFKYQLMYIKDAFESLSSRSLKWFVDIEAILNPYVNEVLITPEIKHRWNFISSSYYKFLTPYNVVKSLNDYHLGLPPKMNASHCFMGRDAFLTIFGKALSKIKYYKDFKKFFFKYVRGQKELFLPSHFNLFRFMHVHGFVKQAAPVKNNPSAPRPFLCHATKIYNKCIKNTESPINLRGYLSSYSDAYTFMQMEYKLSQFSLTEIQYGLVTLSTCMKPMLGQILNFIRHQIVNGETDLVAPFRSLEDSSIKKKGVNSGRLITHHDIEVLHVKLHGIYQEVMKSPNLSKLIFNREISRNLKLENAFLTLLNTRKSKLISDETVKAAHIVLQEYRDWLYKWDYDQHPSIYNFNLFLLLNLHYKLTKVLPKGAYLMWKQITHLYAHFIYEDNHHNFFKLCKSIKNGEVHNIYDYLTYQFIKEAREPRFIQTHVKLPQINLDAVAGLLFDLRALPSDPAVPDMSHLEKPFTYYELFHHNFGSAMPDLEYPFTANCKKLELPVDV